MKSVLVVYGTTEGQTRKIAEFIANAMTARGVEVELVDSAAERAALVQPVYAAAIVCGSLHQHRYQSSLLHFVSDNKAWLAGIPAAFVAVSLTAALKDDESRDELRKIAEAFCRETGWTPAITRHVAGALRYTQYDYFKRLIMKLIAKQQGGDTDTSRDHEYTDWDDLTRFVEEFLAANPLREGGHQPVNPARTGARWIGSHQENIMANRIWLKNYPVGMPAEIDADQFKSIPDLLEKTVRQVRRQAGLSQPRPHDQLRRAGAAVARLCRLPAGTAGHGQGRPRRHHVAQPAAIPGGAVRHPARRHDGGERQSAVHAARAGASAEGLRREGDRHPRELRQCPAAGAREHAGQARDHHPGRRHAADPEALDRQLRDQEGEEDGARLAHRRRHRLPAALARGATGASSRWR